MGQRANLLLITETSRQLFYCHWCANTLPRDLFWGPGFALDFMRQQRPVAGDEWLPGPWAEGGAILDLPRQRLRFFGGEELLDNIPFRRLFLQLMQEAWPGWRLEWACEGQQDLLQAAGVPTVPLASPPADQLPELTPVDPREWNDLVGSIVFEDQSLRLFALFGQVSAYLEAGPALLEAARMAGGLARLALDDWLCDFPRGGFHIDLRGRQLAFWAAYEPGLRQTAVQAWPGWEVRWLEDAFEYQLAQARGMLSLPLLTTEAQLDQVLAMLLRGGTAAGPDAVRQVAARAAVEGRSVTLNPYALREDPLVLDHVTRMTIVAQVVERWRQRGAASAAGPG